MLGPLLLGGGLLDGVGQLHGGLLGTGPGPTGGQRRPPGSGDPGGAQGVDDQDLAEAGPVGQGGPQQVGLDRGGDQWPGPFQDGRDDQGRGLVAAGGPEDQDRVAVLGGQQPAEESRSAAQDHPARLRPRHGEEPQLPAAGPEGAGMLRRPCVAGAVAGRPARQVPQHRRGPAREAAGEAGEAGVHAGRAGQGAAHVGRPGELGVVPVLRQVPQHVADIGGAHVEPGVAEGEAGELAGGPHQRAGARGGAQAEGQELVAGAGERRRVRWPMPTRRQRWPGLMLHPSHLRPSARRGGDQWGNETAAQTRYHRRASWGPTP
jgi:hypothetical protein